MNVISGSLGLINDVLFDYKKYTNPIAHDLVKDRPIFIDYALSFDSAIKANRFSFKNYLKSDLSNKIEYFHKYQWLIDYFKIKAMLIYKTSGDKEYLMLSEELENYY